jgi:transcriptional regulator with XRE-family HTH domain
MELAQRRDIKSVAELAEKSGVGRSHLYDVWKSDGSVTLDTLRKLARALRVPVAVLIDEELLPSPTPYDQSPDIRSVADALATNPLAARHLALTMKALVTADQQTDQMPPLRNSTIAATPESMMPNTDAGWNPPRRTERTGKEARPKETAIDRKKRL